MSTNSTALNKERKRRTRHFTAKDAARCVAYARRDGADDKELAKLIIEAYGLSNMPCMLSQAVLVVADVVFVTALLAALHGLLGILKGTKILVEGAISPLTIIPTEHYIRKFWPELQTHYGVLVAWVGSAEVAAASMIALITSFIDQLAYYQFLDDVCKTKLPANPFPITPKPPNFELFYTGDLQDKAQWERFNELTDTLFPDA